MKNIILSLLLVAGFASAEPSPSSYSSIDSGKGVIAHNFMHGEAIGKILLERNARIIAEIDESRAVSFSPDGKSLLIAEAAMDDDDRFYVMDISGEEVSEPTTKVRIGPRYTVKTEWAADSRSITFYRVPELNAEPEVVKLP